MQWTRDRTGSVGENKKTIGKADFIFHQGSFSLIAGLSSRLSSKCRLICKYRAFLFVLFIYFFKF